MLDEYVLVPDIFDRAAYSNPAFIEMCLPHLKESLLQEALVRDLRDGGWSRFCLEHSGNLHLLCKEILRKLQSNNRLRRFPPQHAAIPTLPHEWCQESLSTHGIEPFTGIIAAHTTKQQFPQRREVASIEKLAGTTWWQHRSPSVTVDRKTDSYLKVLNLALKQANSLMFIDPNLDPNSRNYREFHRLLMPLASRAIKPRIEIHRSLCRGDGPARTIPPQADWKASFMSLSNILQSLNLTMEVFLWDDFHERYLITDIIGVSVPAGFDITGKPDDWSTWGRLGREDKDKIQRLFDPAARPRSLKWPSFTIGASV